MRLIQPQPDHQCEFPVKEGDRVECSVPVQFLRYRYPHHAKASGYDRICDFIDAETVNPSRPLYYAGETILRPFGLASAKLGGFFEYSRYDFVAELALIKEFRRRRDTIFHFVYAEKSFRFTKKLAGKNGNRIVATVHHQKEHHDWLFPSTEHFQSADAIITLTSSLKEAWANHVDPDIVHHIPYGIDTDYFTPGERREPKRRCFFSGYHGRDFDILEKTAKALSERYDDLEFWVVSSAPECERIGQISDKIHWHRRIDDATYLNALREFDLMILPVKEDTANTAILEAMSCGLPIVSNEGAPRDYMDETCGFVMPMGDADGVIAAAEQMLDSVELRREKGRGARQRALQFSWPNIARRTVGLYEQLHCGQLAKT